MTTPARVDVEALEQLDSELLFLGLKSMREGHTTAVETLSNAQETLRALAAERDAAERNAHDAETSRTLAENSAREFEVAAERANALLLRVAAGKLSWKELTAHLRAAGKLEKP